MKHIKDFVARGPNTGGWQDRHRLAVNSEYRAPRWQEGSIVQAIGAWCDYAATHEVRFESPIGQDYVLGPAWARWGFALRELLNGNLGRLDAGTLDTIIHDNLAEQGYNPDGGAP